jgi:hypothetical protein
VCCFWIIDPLPTSLNAKSNVAAAAAAVRHELGTDPLVLSTQPEQVPTIAYYLPRVRHFGTPLGRVPDPRVVDWRGALARFRRSTPQTVLAPMVAALAPGQRVALVVPTHLPSEPLYLKLVNLTSQRWASYLRHDRALKLVTAQAPHKGGSGLPVEILVFRRL